MSTTEQHDNVYLAGNLAPVHEERTDLDLAVTGTIPQYLEGRYLRNGPNPIDADPATYNWLTGAGMIHGVRLRDGKAEWYRNRWVRTTSMAQALGEEPRPGELHMGLDFPANISVMGHAGRTYALMESGARPYELTYELDTVGVCDFDGTLPGGYTAHPLKDSATGDVHAISYFWGWGDRIQYSVLDTDGRIKHTRDIEVPGSPMMHSFTLTERYIVIYDQPVVFDINGGGGIAFPFRWDPDHPNRVGVLSRDTSTSEVRWFDVGPGYVYHPLNGYDDVDHVVLDVARHPSTFRTNFQGPTEGVPTLDRWTLDLATGQVREDRLDERYQEFPRLDDRQVGRHHRYGYTVGYDRTTGDDPGDGYDVLFKHDMDTGRCTERRLAPGRGIGEVVFVPSGPDAGEDDGVLVGFVHDAATNRSDLEILDAGTLETVASVHLPVRVPAGIHGNWVGD